MCDVLILEDDLLVRSTFADILADEGFIPDVSVAS